MSLGQIIRDSRESLGLTQDQLASRVGISKPYLSNIETGKAKNPPTDGVLKSLERALDFEVGQLTRLAHLVRTPVDVLAEHELLEAQVQKLRGVLKGLIADGRRSDGEPGGDIACGIPDIDGMGADGNIRAIPAGVAVPVINNVSAGYPHHFTDLDYPPSVADDYIRCPDLHDPQAFAARVVGDSMEPSYYEGDIVVFSPNTPVHSGDDCFVRFEGDGETTFKRFYEDDEETIRLQPLNSQYASRTHPRESITGLWPAVFRIQRLRR